MTSRTVKIPGPEHPITIAPTGARVVVTVGGRTIADSTSALTLTEASYPPVQYIPRKDVDMAQLARSTHQSYCPYKGEAAYFSIAARSEAGSDAVWTYESPYEAVAAIKDHLAFYPDHVDAIRVLPA